MFTKRLSILLTKPAQRHDLLLSCMEETIEDAKGENIPAELSAENETGFGYGYL